MTRRDHRSGTDRLAEVVALRRYPRSRIVVNVQGDEPLIAPVLIRRVAESLHAHRQAQIATAAFPLANVRELSDPNAVKVVLDGEGYALYFSRAPIPYARDAFAAGIRSLPRGLPVYRHIGLYAYRAAFLGELASLPAPAIERFEALEQLRALFHGYRISVALTRSAPHPGIDTPADLERVRALLTRRRARSAGERNSL